MLTTNLEATHAYYLVIDEESGFPLGSVQPLLANFGDQFVMFGLLAHCDSKGDLIEPGQQLLFAMGQEHNGDVVQIYGEAEMHRVVGLPNGAIDINSEQTKVGKDIPKIVWQDEYKTA